MHPLFEGSFGYANALHITDPAAARAVDARMDAALAAARRSFPAPGPARSILLLLPAYPKTAPAVSHWARHLHTRHSVHAHVDARVGVGRLAKINALVAAAPAAFDWLIVIDDDVAIPAGWFDTFIDTLEAAAFVIANPAHNIHSFASFAVTQRQPGSIARTTAFVEQGPVVAIHRSILPHLMPLPEMRWGWGIDFVWAQQARAYGWRIGIVDGAPITHLRAPAAAYDMREAFAEANAMLARHKLTITRTEMLAPGTVVIALPPDAGA